MYRCFFQALEQMKVSVLGLWDLITTGELMSESQK